MADDSKSKKPRSVNFSQNELVVVKSLVLKHPIIEKKLHDQKTETMRKVAWEAIRDEFNSDPSNSRRTVQQLKGAWKRIKRSYKSQKAAERRSKFKTGGGPQSPPPEDDREIDEMFSEQTPLENIPDDDDDYNGEFVGYMRVFNGNCV